MSILDLSAAGRQPMGNEDGTVWVVFNGEIYNYPELREGLLARGHRLRSQSDTEAIVHLYEEYGDACVEHLRGMFGFALWDCRRERLLLARDRLGVKPVYYTEAGGSVVFASELKALLQHPAVTREIDRVALDQYLTYLYVPGPRTIFRGIRKLLPGHRLLCEQGSVRVEQYWDIASSGEGDLVTPRSVEEAAEQLRGLLEESVRQHLLSDVPIGAFLSGGVDSSTVVALMAREMDRPVKTFSMGFDVRGYDELEYARVVARHFGTEHHEEAVVPRAACLLPDLAWHFDEPFADSSAIPTYLVSKMARRHVTVVLAGDGGDELFAGYSWARSERYVQMARRVPAPLRRAAARCLPGDDRGASRLHRLGRLAQDAARSPSEGFARRVTCFTASLKRALYSESLAAAAGTGNPYTGLLRHLNDPGVPDFGSRMLLADTRQYLPDDDLTKVDRMSMACSLEARVPLLDHRVAGFAARLPFAWKLRGGTTKYVLKRAMRDLLPDGILRQRKQGFAIPVAHWLRGELNEPARRLLEGPRAVSRELFRPEAVRRLFEQHESGAQNLGHQLWALLMLETWSRVYLDGPVSPSPPQVSLFDLV